MIAVEIKQSDTKPVKEISEITGCSLAAIQGAHVLGSDLPYEKALAARLDHPDVTGPYRGEYVTGYILTLMGPECTHAWGSRFEKAKAALEAKGWKLLGRYPGAHRDNYGKYWMYLFGSPSFQTSEEIKNASK